MSKKNTTVPGRVAGFLGENSYIIVFVAIFIVYALTTNGLTWSGMMNVFRHSAVIGIIGLGMGLICITGEIDLSVGSMLALDGGFSVIIFNMTNSIILTFLFAVLFGAFCGLINGVMVGWIQMPAFIVTLATMLIYRSFAQYFCQHVDKALIGGGSSVYKMANSQSSYQTLYNFGNGKVSTIPIVGLILIIMTLVFVYITTSTKYGKKVYAVGSNMKGAQMAGINTAAVKISVFVIAGGLVGIGAFLWIAMTRQPQETAMKCMRSQQQYLAESACQVVKENASESCLAQCPIRSLTKLLCPLKWTLLSTTQSRELFYCSLLWCRSSDLRSNKN